LTKRTSVVLAGVLLLAVLAPAHSWAFDQTARPFGLGLSVGSPSGLAAKYYVAPHAAVQGTLGIGWHGIGLTADYLYEFRDLIPTRGEPFNLPVFIGAGLKLGGRTYCERGPNAVCRATPLAGVRIPLGAALQLHHIPLEFQIEFAPVVAGHLYGAQVGADMALVVRYFF
jgi:hypothetical protein